MTSENERERNFEENKILFERKVLLYHQKEGSICRFCHEMTLKFIEDTFLAKIKLIFIPNEEFHIDLKLLRFACVLVIKKRKGRHK